MKTISRFFLIPVLSLLISATAFAAPKAAPAPAPQDEALLNKQMTEFYQKDGEYRKDALNKRSALLKEMTDLYAKINKTKDEKERNKLAGEIKENNKKMGALSEEMAKKDVETAEFSLKMAQHRVERSKATLVQIQEQNKKIAK